MANSSEVDAMLTALDAAGRFCLVGFHALHAADIRFIKEREIVGATPIFCIYLLAMASSSSCASRRINTKNRCGPGGRAAFRMGLEPAESYDTLGFRVVLARAHH
jgi:hypothetical protein